MRIALFLLTIITSVFSAEDPNIAKIYASNGRDKTFCATAFFVSPNRLITAAHTFGSGMSNSWIKKGGANIAVTVIHCDHERDICLVETIGYTNPSWFTLQRNGVVTLKGFRYENPAQSDESVRKDERLSTYNEIIDGESGGPLVNESGQVIGMGIMSHKRTCISVSSDTIAKFLDEHPAKP